ncbi:uncharacterized protein LOC131430847 [Malaya genurostris]|uniref:uncharacterized protein LOC131430847 n=1 Tax=Malaya genurostris TaxID=325434 RepID=UPI0026F3E0DE|nr:uncharacterized protein LOC131430847 [Malaya genurostris]
MAMIGSLDHYLAGTSFSNYIERLEFLSQLNGWAEEKKKSILIALSGSVVYDELKLIFPAVELKTLKYDDIVKKLKERFDKIEPDMMQRYRFYNRFQGSDESAENFILAIKLQAEHCDFKEFKDTAIRDRLIMGVFDKDLQRSLLLEEDLALTTVERKIVNSELAGKRARLINANKIDVDGVLAIKNRLGRREIFDNDRYNDRRFSGQHRKNGYGYNENRVSFRRDFRKRSASASRNRNSYASAICNYCKKKGHLRRDCYSYKNRNSVRFLKNDTREESYNFKRSKERDSSVETDGLECMMISTIRKNNDPCMVEAVVQGCVLSMEIDSGSAVSVISEADFQKLFSNIPLVSSKRQLVVVNGKRLKILGEIDVKVKLNGFEHQHMLVVLECRNRFVPLIGRSWLDCFYPDWRSGFVSVSSVNSLTDEKGIEKVTDCLKSRYKQVFNKDFSEPIVGYEGELILKHEQPIFKKAYTVPFKLKDKMLEHLDMLEQQKVITPIEASEWASPVIVVVKKDQDIRMVVDCKEHTYGSQESIKIGKQCDANVQTASPRRHTTW